MFYHQLKSGISRSVSITALVCLFAVSASAYTLIMRSGRRVEIPDMFTVTRSTLTYEVSPGMQVTLQMQAIDIGATERANGERPGSLLRRIQSTIPQLPAPTYTGAVRTITNSDLRAAKERRQQSEAAYHQRVKQLGLPSLEESRQRAAAESEIIGEQLREVRSVRNNTEQYWRSRASELRTEMAVVDAEIEYVAARINEYPDPNRVNSITSIIPYDPVYDRRRYRRRGGYNTGPQIVIGQRDPWGRDRTGPWGIGNIGTIPNVNGPYGAGYDYSFERSQLVNRYNELSAQRAGLRVRWRELEQEARRAGASPGWLRE